MDWLQFSDKPRTKDLIIDPVLFDYAIHHFLPPFNISWFCEEAGRFSFSISGLASLSLLYQSMSLSLPPFVSLVWQAQEILRQFEQRIHN